jgi:hypothetical protein
MTTLDYLDATMLDRVARQAMQDARKRFRRDVRRQAIARKREFLIGE